MDERWNRIWRVGRQAKREEVEGRPGVKNVQGMMFLTVLVSWVFGNIFGLDTIVPLLPHPLQRNVH